MSDGYRIFERNSDFGDEEEMTEYSATELDEMCDSCIHKVSKEDIEALIQQSREDAINDVKSWFDAEFKKQNDPNSKFVPSCVIKENIYDVLEQIKEKHDKK